MARTRPAISRRRGELEISDAHTWLIEHGYAVGYAEITGWWKDTGTVDAMLEANRLILEDIHRDVQGEVDDESKVEGRVVLAKGETAEDASLLPIPHPEIFAAAIKDMELLIDDGRLRLRVTNCGPDFAETVVLTGGRISDNKGVNVPDVVLPIPALTEKDRADLEFACQHGANYIGLSFVQRPEDVAEAKRLIDGRAWTMVKLEKPQALDNLDAIMALTDTVMVARGENRLRELATASDLVIAGDLTDEPEQTLIAELIREAALEGVREELPHSIRVLGFGQRKFLLRCRRRIPATRRPPRGHTTLDSCMQHQRRRRHHTAHRFRAGALAGRSGGAPASGGPGGLPA